MTKQLHISIPNGLFGNGGLSINLVKRRPTKAERKLYRIVDTKERRIWKERAEIQRLYTNGVISVFRYQSKLLTWEFKWRNSQQQKNKCDSRLWTCSASNGQMTIELAIESGKGFVLVREQKDVIVTDECRGINS